MRSRGTSTTSLAKTASTRWVAWTVRCFLSFLAFPRNRCWIVILTRLGGFGGMSPEDIFSQVFGGGGFGGFQGFEGFPGFGGGGSARPRYYSCD